MVKRMNKYVSIVVTVIVIFLISGVSIYKVIKNHNDKLLLVESNYIIMKAKDCYNKKECSSEEITLQELYEKNYLERQVNPVTKEYYNESSYVKINGAKSEFIVL